MELNVTPCLNVHENYMSTIFINSYSQGGGANWYDGAYAAWQAKGAASYAASLLDLSGNGNHAFEGVAPTWDAVNGWSFDGIDDYLRTPITPGSTYSAIVAVSDMTPKNNSGIFGSYGGIGKNLPPYFFVSSSAVGSMFYGCGGVGSIAPSATAGVFAIVPTAAYRNGIFDVSIPTAGWTTPNQIYIGIINSNNVAYTPMKISSFGIWNYALDAATVATKSAQMAAL